MKLSKSSFAAAVILMISISSIIAQSGTLDPTFNDDGILTFTITPGNLSTDNAFAIAMQPDGKIVVGGQTWTGSNRNFALARITTVGTLDSTFHEDGITTTAIGKHSIIKAIVIQPDGKIVAAGNSETNMHDGFLLARFNPDGHLDSTFGTLGKVITKISGEEDGPRSIALQPDGKIVVGGYSGRQQNQDFALARYDANGSLDPTFDEDGIVLTSFNDEPDGITSIALQPDGKIVACGYSYLDGISRFALARYNTDGTQDPSFDTDGFLASVLDPEGSQAWSLAIQQDGKIVAGGSFGAYLDSDFGLVRYLEDGTIDHTFGNNGLTRTDIDSSDTIFSLALWPDGRMVAGGTTANDTIEKFALTQYDLNGILNISFGTNGITTTQIGVGHSDLRALCFQPDGKIVVAGNELFSPVSNWDFVVARYLTDFHVGVADFTSHPSSLSVYPNPVRSEAEISYFLTASENLSLHLFNLQGQLVQSFYQHQLHEAGTHREKIRIDSSLPDALYFLELNNGRGSVMIQVLKQ